MTEGGSKTPEAVGDQRMGVAVAGQAAISGEA